MAESSTRAPTPAQTWVSPLAALSDGNLYPYWNLQNGGLTPILSSIKRSLAFINPFKIQQVPTHDRAAIGIMEGGKFYREEPYPNSITFTSKYPSHYDPLSDQRFKAQANTKHTSGRNPTLGVKDVIPKFCHRQIKIYKRCLVANDDRADVCRDQQENIMSICPSFALDTLRQHKLADLKSQAMNNQKYHQVMKVPGYNKGRTVADVPLKSWADGTPDMLRPNTLWADDRYADVTDDEIKAAQERVNKRRAANPEPRYQNEVYNRKYEVPPKNKLFSL